MKFYVYVSDTKLDMLYDQIPVRLRDKLAAELKIDLKFLATTLSQEPLEKNRYAKLSVVVDYIDKHLHVGTVDKPDSFFRGTLPMRWGILGGINIPEPDFFHLVYFGGVTEHTILGLGGSAKHVVGTAGTDSQFSLMSSNAPNIIYALAKERQIPETDLESIAENTIAWATTQHMTGPIQKLDFLAKRLMDGYERRGKGMRVLLGSPIYVALAE